MGIAAYIKQHKTIKQFLLYALMPKNQARPRLWVKLFILPFFINKGKGAKIQKRSRIDVLPTNEVYIGANSTIEDYCTINNGMGEILIGDNTRIGIGSVLIGPVHIGHNVRLAQNVVITSLNHNYSNISKPISEQGVHTETISIGDEVWIGANAVILPGILIGKHSVVAAGSVVTKDIPPYTVVAGNPARIIKQYNAETKKWERVDKKQDFTYTHSVLANYPA